MPNSAIAIALATIPNTSAIIHEDSNSSVRERWKLREHGDARDDRFNHVNLWINKEGSTARVVGGCFGYRCHDFNVTWSAVHSNTTPGNGTFTLTIIHLNS